MTAAAASVVDGWRERIATARSTRRPLRLRGGGSKDFYGEALEGEILELSSWTGIVHYEPSELVLTARCGTPLAEIEATLAAHGQFLAFEPPAFGTTSTIGGVIAAGLSGPRRAFVGAARDFVLGTRLINAQGEHLRFGGEVMKNVAGFDLSRLLCGSLGILGIISEVSLKVLPRPRAEQTLRLELPADAAIERFNRWAATPLPLSGAAWWQGCAWVRLSGAAPAVQAACAQLGGERLGAAEAQAFWDALRHCQLPPFGHKLLWRVSLPSAAAPLAVPGEALIDWGGALRWHADPPPEVSVRELAQLAGGTALLWHGNSEQTRFHPLAAPARRLHERLKAQLDPQGIFNPGRLLPGL